MRTFFGAHPPGIAGARHRTIFEHANDLLMTLDAEAQAELIGGELWNLSPSTNPIVVEQIASAADSLVRAVVGPQGHVIGPAKKPPSSPADQRRARATSKQVSDLLAKLDDHERGRFLAHALENLSDDVSEHVVRPIERHTARLAREVLEPHRARQAHAWHDDDLWTE